MDRKQGKQQGDQMSRNRGLGSQRNEEETGKPVQFDKDGKEHQGGQHQGGQHQQGGQQRPPEHKPEQGQPTHQP